MNAELYRILLVAVLVAGAPNLLAMLTPQFWTAKKYRR